MLATAPADSAETFTVPQRTARSMVPWGWRAVARPSTRARCSLAQNRAMGINWAKPRIEYDFYEIMHLADLRCPTPDLISDRSFRSTVFQKCHRLR